jgi:hypothetical protein
MMSSVAIVTSVVTIATATSAITIAIAIVTSAIAIVTSAETAHVTSSAKAAAAVSTAATATASTAAACLCTRRKQRPGKHGACQYHHHSSCSHDIFLSTDRAISSLPNMLLYGRAKMRLVFDQQHSISSRLLNAIQPKLNRS